MKKILLILLLVVNSLMSQTTINYNSSDSVLFNPDRGFFKFSGTNSTNYSLLNENTLNGYKNGVDKISMIYRGFYLPTGTISSTYLNNMQTDFNRLRNTGMKAIIRFAYVESSSCTSCQPNKAQILSHITQLAPVINNNKDVITAIQMGFIGGYGEWYYTNSTEFGSEDYTSYTNTQWNNRKEVVDAIYNSVSDLPILLRYPYAKVKMYGVNYKDRIGFFNDAFLNTYGDEGFFPIGQNASPSQAQIQEVVLQTTFNPMVGESNGVSNRTNGANAIIELARYKWSALNRDYYTPVITGWQNDGTYLTIINQLGYRFELKTTEWQNDGHTLSFKLNMRNSGYTAPFKNRKVTLVLNTYEYTIDADIRYWDNDFNYEGQIDINNLPEGVYDAYLKFEDKIQLANVNVFDGEKNRLFYSFEKTNLGINEITDEFSFYPNPTKDIVNFSKEIEYKIYNTLGQKLFEGVSNKINLTEYFNGVYLVKLKNNQTIKIIKQ